MAGLFCRTVSRVAWLGAIVSALVMMAMVCLILVEIVLRSVFHSSTYVLDEFVGYGVATMTFLALARTLERGAHIRVGLLRNSAPRGMSRIMELGAVLVALATSLGVGWYIGRSVLRNYRRGAVSETIAEVPLWIPECMVLVGLALLCLSLIAHGLRVLAGEPTASGEGAN